MCQYPSWAAYERELSACAVLDPSLRSLKPSDTRAGIAVEMHPNVYEGRRADRNKDMARNPPPRCLYWRSAPISAPSTNAAKRLTSESRKSPKRQRTSAGMPCPRPPVSERAHWMSELSELRPSLIALNRSALQELRVYRRSWHAQR